MNSIRLKSDSFNTLLTSLSKSEKRYLELYFLQEQTQDSLYLTYFKAYKNALKNKHKSLKLPTDFPLGRLPSIKNYLKEKILFVLGKFHQKSTKRNEILEHLKFVEVLFNKRLYKECASLLRQLEKKATQFWAYNLLLEILQWQLRLLLSNGYNEELKISFSNLYSKEKKLLNSLSMISFYREIRYELLKILSQRQFSNPIEDNQIFAVRQMLKNTISENLLPYATLEYDRTMSLYYRLIGNYKNAFMHSKNEMSIWNNNFSVFNDRVMTSKYINGHINKCEILFFLGAYDQCKEEFGKLQKNVRLIENEQNNRVLYLAQSYLLMLGVNMIKRDYNDNSNLILEIEHIFLNKLNSQKIAEFLYVFAVNSFHQKKWNNCLHYANRLINEYKSTNNSDLDSLAQFFRILVHFELGNHEVVENLIQRFSNNITEMTLLFKSIHLYFKQPLLHRKLSKTLFNEMEIVLSKRKQTHKIYIKLYYLVFLDWINSRKPN